MCALGDEPIRKLVDLAIAVHLRQVSCKNVLVSDSPWRRTVSVANSVNWVKLHPSFSSYALRQSKEASKARRPSRLRLQRSFQTKATKPELCGHVLDVSCRNSVGSSARTRPMLYVAWACLDVAARNSVGLSAEIAFSFASIASACSVVTGRYHRSGNR